MADEVKPAEKFADAKAVLACFAVLGQLGSSAGGNPIYGTKLKGSARRVLFLAGVHGNETEGVAAALGFFNEYQEKKISPRAEIFFIPVFNPDGLLAHSRHNANGVDLNRNLPTQDWQKNTPGDKYYSGPMPGSEPETQLLLQVMADFQPDFILSLHSWKPMFNTNGPAHREAQKMAQELNYPITEDIGYPTPGSLGTYAGHERGIPTITFEIERGLPLDTVWPTVRGAILSVLS